MPDMFYPGQQDYITKLNELSNSIVPATDTLANLRSLNTGEGRLTSATDVAAIVQLNGTPGSGTVAEYCPMYPGTYFQNTNGRVTTLKPTYPWLNLTVGHTFTIAAPDSDITSGQGATSLSLLGANTSAGISGGVYIAPGYPPVGKSAGDITLQGRNTDTAGTGSDIAINAGYGTNGATNGSITFKVNNATILKLGSADTIGFFGATAVAKPTVSGSKATGAALTSLLSALSSLGLILDSTEA